MATLGRAPGSATVEFRVLGPVEAWIGGARADLGHARQRSVLAVLLAEAGRVVPVEQLIDRIWGDAPPRSARSILYGYVARLRSALDGGAGILQRRSGGYVVAVPHDSLDLHRFRRLTGTARTREPLAAAGLLRDALRLWRGPAFTGLTSRWLRGLGEALDVELWNARLDAAEAELDLGHHATLLHELRGWAAERPLDERLAGQLMLAAHRSGQQAVALRTYHELRRRLADELGVDPGHRTRLLHERILHDDSGLDHPQETGRRAPPPSQTPRDIPDFAGREPELARLHGLFTADGHADVVTVVLVHGSAGVGKTALAVHAVHRLAHRFPDGVLHVDLRGYHPRLPALDAGDALGQFLRALGADSRRIPAEQDERAALFRTLTAGQRLLVLLDNAAAPDQVRPLLPASAGSAALVTSRNRMDGLVARDGAHAVELGVLSPTEAKTLLHRLIGEVRTDAEPGEVGRLAAACARLPLALRIAAERVISRPGSRLAGLAAELAAEHGRLDMLASGDDDAAAVRAAFSWSYHALEPAAGRMFRLLGLHPGTDIGVGAAAALAGLPPKPARELLTALACVHLVETAGAHRFRLHDLLRVYAAERAAHESAAEAGAAAHRELAWYLHTADAADRLLAPQRRHIPLGPPPAGCRPQRFDDRRDAATWCEAERDNLVAAVHRAAETGEHAIAWQLPSALWGFCTLRRYWPDWLAMHRLGLAAAERAGDLRGQATCLNHLGGGYAELGRLTEAIDLFRRSLVLCRRSGDRYAAVTAQNNLGATHLDLGRHAEAIGWSWRALVQSREIGDRWGEGYALHNLGATHRGLRRPADAVGCLQRALTISRDIGARWDEAFALHNLGEVFRDLGRLDEALDCLRQSVEVRSEIGDRHGAAQALISLGTALCDAGCPEAARAARNEADAVLRELGDPFPGTGHLPPDPPG